MPGGEGRSTGTRVNSARLESEQSWYALERFGDGGGRQAVADLARAEWGVVDVVVFRTTEQEDVLVVSTENKLSSQRSSSTHFGGVRGGSGRRGVHVARKNGLQAPASVSLLISKGENGNSPGHGACTSPSCLVSGRVLRGWVNTRTLATA